MRRAAQSLYPQTLGYAWHPCTAHMVCVSRALLFAGPFQKILHFQPYPMCTLGGMDKYF